MKKTLLAIGTVILILSLNLNLYFLVIKSIEQRAYQHGASDTTNLIVGRVQQLGEVSIATDKGPVILVRKTKKSRGQE